MAFKKYDQDPADVLKYPFDWQSDSLPAAQRFLAPGVVLEDCTFAAYTRAGSPPVFTPSADVVLTEADFDDTTSQVMVGFVETPTTNKYYVTSHAIASDGQEKDWTIQINLKEQ